MSFKAIMLDLETMGSNPRAPIVSLGAVAFDPMGHEPVEELPSFYRNVDLESSLRYGLAADGSTIMWWLGQSEEARKRLTDPAPVDLRWALLDFSKWMSENRLEEVWAHATFDPVVVRSSYDAIREKLPWSHRDTRDIRTLVDLGKRIGYEPPASGASNDNAHVAHTAVDDCRYQISYVRPIYQALVLRTQAAAAAA